ncbi:collagen-like protein [Paenibacillus sp. FSL R5-0744]|uniref:collagen-like protein n=1 Tax=Paenibacillus sp. FSL R5-0744 TaxID=2921656 RepID=UPI0030DDA56A
MGFFPTPGSGQFPGFPGGPGGFPGTPGPPGAAPGGVQAPTAPPPQFVPQMSATAFAIDPGAIRGCLFRNTYIWLNNGEQFWFFPVFVGRNSVAGFRWFGLFWGYFGIDLNRIRSFTCF